MNFAHSSGSWLAALCWIGVLGLACSGGGANVDSLADTAADPGATSAPNDTQSAVPPEQTEAPDDSDLPHEPEREAEPPASGCRGLCDRVFALQCEGVDDEVCMQNCNEWPTAPCGPQLQNVVTCLIEANTCPDPDDLAAALPDNCRGRLQAYTTCEDMNQPTDM
ncbi:MAG TPA: hypothetical protein VFQ61_29705 [Polyangiaceae bacterium]|nr:hypothetical protein [Polyangiaceae bacterium]